MEPVNAATQQPQGALSSAIGGAEIAKDDFLRLLVAQLRHQNPVDPVANEDFLTQLATFTGLEEQRTATKTLQNMVALQEAGLVLGGLAQGASLVGKEVTYLDPDTGEELRGIVSGVVFDTSGVLLDVGGRQIPSGNVVSVGMPAAAPPDPSPTPPSPGPGSGPTGSGPTATVPGTERSGPEE